MVRVMTAVADRGWHRGMCTSLISIKYNSNEFLLILSVLLTLPVSFQNALKHTKLHKIAYQMPQNRLRLGSRQRFPKPLSAEEGKTPSASRDRRRLTSNVPLLKQFSGSATG